MRTRFPAACLVAGLVLTPASAYGALLPALAATPPPRSGVWTMSSGGAKDDELVGTFTISSTRVVSKLHGTIRVDAPRACGSGTVTVLGSERIIDATGINPEGKRYSQWVVGVNAPGADPVIRPTRVQLIVGRRSVQGSLDIVFSSLHGESVGDIYYDAGNCDLNFLVQRRPR